MTPADFRHQLAALGMSQRGFAAYTGSNERTVRRWALGEQDLPAWVPVMLRLMRQVGAATSPTPESEMSHLSERAARIVRNGKPTNTAWLRGWDAAVASLPAGSNPYSRRPQMDAWARGYAAGRRSGETDVLALKNRTQAAAYRHRSQ